MPSRAGLLHTIKQKLDQLDRENIYRSVLDDQGNTLSSGLLPMGPELLMAFQSICFRNKSVIDLGCNLGHFSFLAAQLGAAHVTGIDQHPTVIEIARLLADLYQIDNIDFRTYDLENDQQALGKFDLVLLIDFFGKSNTIKGKIPHYLGLLEALTDKAVLTSFRPISRIEKDLKISEEEFQHLYSQEYIRQGYFYLIDYIEDTWSNKWRITPVSKYTGSYTKEKMLFLFEHRSK